MFIVPPRQCHPGISPVQFARQPMLSNMFPSSQISVPTFLPSPHIGVQVVVSPRVEYVFTHVHPDSKEHKFEHPSFSTKLPSSHYSVPLMYPSPQSPKQETGVVSDPPKQFHPGKFPEQSDKHPILSSGFPSSHISPGFIIPSPQIGVQVVLSGL